MDIALACAAALDAGSFIPRGAVTADVTDGWVTLSGRVCAYYQRQEAEYAVRGRSHAGEDGHARKEDNQGSRERSLRRRARDKDPADVVREMP